MRRDGLDDEFEENPLTIINDRYGGAYSGGSYTAFLEWADDVSAVYGQDIEAMTFWASYTKPVGRGDSPIDAFYSLKREFEDGARFDMKKWQADSDCWGD